MNDSGHESKMGRGLGCSCGAASGQNAMDCASFEAKDCDYASGKPRGKLDGREPEYEW